MTSTEVFKSVSITDDALASIKSFDDAVALLNAQFGTESAESISDYGTGFTLITDKNVLIGIPFLIVQWRFNEGDYSSEFVSAELVTQAGDKIILNDGSTGIYRQLRGVTDQRIKAGKTANAYAGLAVPKGLTRTDYWFNEDTKETSSKPQTGKGWGPAKTYYLAQ